jgi:XTP/dITP diphosphohydrolase
MKIRFLSANELKLAEVRTILEPVGVEVLPIARRIEEIQTENEVELVRDKLTKAFSIIGRPLFVEHTGLYLDGLNGLPAGLTRIFWSRLNAERFTKLVNGLDSPCVTAKTVLGYCDGQKNVSVRRRTARHHRHRACWSSRISVGLRVYPGRAHANIRRNGRAKK